METSFRKIANRVSVITIIGNVILSLFKFMAGIMAHSNAMISDAIHSASDVFSTIVVIMGIKFASKPPDKEHPYGHERLECVTAIILAMILFMTGLWIGLDAITCIFKSNYHEAEVPKILAMVAAIISIVSKEAMYWYTRYYAKKIESDALMADAWHHRSDAFSSIGALIGIAGTRLGFPIMDSLASIAISLFVAKAAFDIFRDAMDKMIDHACDDDMEQHIRACVLENKNIMGVKLLKTRIFGNKIYVDVEIMAAASSTLKEAHHIARDVHNKIEETFPKVKHIMVYVSPATHE